MLAILLLAPAHRLTIERIADLLWDGEPPESSRGTIQTYIGRLRRMLAPYDVAIVTSGDGYLVEPGAHTVDVEEFRQLIRDAADLPDPADQVRQYDVALELWRGPLLADVAGDKLRARLDSALDDLRMTAAELRAQAQLIGGLHERVVTELPSLVDAAPTRERLVGYLMTGLYRGGRKAEALALYRHTRSVLIDELGIEPGRELQEIHEQILRADPVLDGPSMPLFAVRIDDQWLPWNTSGHPALEFCNTYAGWGSTPSAGADWLDSYAALAVWSGHHTLTDGATVHRLRAEAQRQPAAAAHALELARDLRTQLYSCLTDPRDHAAFGSVARHVDAASRFSIFRLDEDGLGHWRIVADAGLHLPVYAVARVAADLLADSARFMVRACPSPECGWLFPDRGGQRRYCSVALCGKDVTS